MWDGRDFHGAKIALVMGDCLVTYKRDDIPTIPNPGLWDLPGGGREGDETPIFCAIREVEEEFGLTIDAATVEWCRPYSGTVGGAGFSYFLVAPLDRERLEDVRFGNEGERWEVMRITDFLNHHAAVPSLQSRLRDWIAARKPDLLR
ncbi:MAG: NUDIX hydrolase [Rhizobiaceae bacterium]|nr:NUDIX hydrolase [Rhizobiaceae bacterium]